MILARSLAERLANLIRRRRLLYAQYAVIILRLVVAIVSSILQQCACFRTSKSNYFSSLDLPAWQVGHQNRFRPAITFVKIFVPHTKHGLPLPPIHIVRLFLQHLALRMRPVRRLRRHDSPVDHPRLHQHARILPYRPQRLLLYLLARRKRTQLRSKQQLRAKDISNPRRHRLVHQQRANRLPALRRPSQSSSPAHRHSADQAPAASAASPTSPACRPSSPSAHATQPTQSSPDAMMPRAVILRVPSMPLAHTRLRRLLHRRRIPHPQPQRSAHLRQRPRALGKVPLQSQMHMQNPVLPKVISQVLPHSHHALSASVHRSPPYP